MKTLVTIILILACAGLLIALVVTQKHIDAQRKKDADTILDFSNQVVAANDELNELRQVNLELTNDLNSSREQLAVLSNQVLAVSDSLSNSEAQVKVADDQIASLEAQNQALDQHASDLTNTIAELNAKIAAAQNELAAAQTNNSFLATELKKQMADKAALQKKFEDLAAVRAQARKLHDELITDRRLQWIREGSTSQRKGASLLMAREWPTNSLAPASHYNLTVEVSSSGAVRIVPAGTNAPATNSSQ